MEKKFLGLDEVQSKYETSKIVILPVPFDLTSTYIKGADKGPSALIEASEALELYDIETDSSVYKLGIHTAATASYQNSTNMIDGLHKIVKKNLDDEKFVVAIGGEHSISTATIRAHADNFGPISVLHFDAHSDLVPAYEGNPYSHASVISRIKELESVKSVVSVGIRSMSEEEKQYVDYDNTFFAHKIHEDPTCLERIPKILSDNVYITFDLDVFDLSIMPATGTPEPGGLFWHQVIPIIQQVASTKNIIGFDVVELCPIPGLDAPNFLAAKLIYKLLSFRFQTPF